MKKQEQSELRRKARRLLFDASQPDRPAFAAGFAATCGVVAMRLALPWPLRGIVEAAFPDTGTTVAFAFAGHGQRAVLIFCGLYVAFAAATGAFEWIQRLWMARVAGRTAHRIRVDAVANLRRSGGRSDSDAADLITRVVGDVARIRADLKGILIHLLQNGLLMLAIIGLFFVLAPLLALLLLIGGLLATWIGFRAVEAVAQTTARHRRRESEYAASIHDEDDEASESEAISASSTKKDVRVTRIIGRSTLLAHVAVALTISVALWIGVGDVQAGALQPGELFLFIAYAITIQRRSVMIGRQVARTGKLQANTERLVRLIDEHRSDDAAARDLNSAVALEGVKIKRFVTHGSTTRLALESLTIPRGQKLLVLGPEGAGKSSLLALLAGRLSLQRGTVRWDGEPMTEAGEQLRASTAYLSDEPRFGRVTLRRWIGLPDGEPIDESKIATLKAVGAWKLIRRLRKGLEQRIPSSHLSPRERRTLGLARIVFSAADLWLLDNPVDADRAGERTRLKAILELCRDKSLVVALRVPVLPDSFDRIVVLRRGKVEFDGSPAEWRERRRQLRVIRASTAEG